MASWTGQGDATRALREGRRCCYFPLALSTEKPEACCMFPSAAQRSSSRSCGADVPWVSRSTQGAVSQDSQVFLTGLMLKRAALRLS